MTTTTPTGPRLAVAPPRRDAAGPLRVLAPGAPATAPGAPDDPGSAAPPVEVRAAVPGAAQVLTGPALDFLADLHTRFAGRRAELLAARHERRQRLVTGALPDFLPETAPIRADRSWQVAPPPPGLVDRRVEITAPPDRRSAAAALRSGAQVWVADLADGTAPHLAAVVAGQTVLHDVVRGQAVMHDAVRGLAADAPAGTPTGDAPAGAPTGGPPAAPAAPTVVLRPRGWHLVEKHLRVDGEPMVGALVDAGLYLFHNAAELLARGTGPYLSLPALENHLEARLWRDVFVAAEDALGLPRGSVRATATIETVMAAFEMEEILYELREHSAGLSLGRPEAYLFSVIKKFRDGGPAWVLPDWTETTVAPFLRARTELLVRTCHKRGAHAIGATTAVVPTEGPAGAEVITEVRAQKQREADAGLDGSGVADPGLVGVVADVFTGVLGTRPHQLWRTREEVHVTARDLLAVGTAPGRITRDGLRTNVAVALRYLQAWLGGRGTVPLAGLAADTATAEVCRAQVWQWVRTGARTADGAVVTADLVAQVLAEEVAAATRDADGEADRQHVAAAADLVAEVALGEEFPTFLTLPAYARWV
ncbi:malate synthase [Georgenia sp. TF02-10]|uniref:malate synthase n=1 Tax=Georgenia sp. TF02-10 TaxID=2917725 RepID=UPI001FA7B2A7|nr:malate synthase [Georgenia sp. TF02-10]UNX55790.1 malate synthase [Georgenia sp. TF02-10]